MLVNLGSCVICFNTNGSNHDWRYSIEAGTDNVILTKYIGNNTNVTVPSTTPEQ